MTFFDQFALAFIPVLVALDPIGILPIYISLSADLDAASKRKTTAQAVIAATCFALLFLLVGKAFFKIIGVTQDDFKIAGGLILLILAVIDILSPEKPLRKPTQDFGVVPIGVPLIVGPAVLTTELMLVDLYGPLVTGAAVVLNILLAGAMLYASDWFRKMLGDALIRAISKIVSLLLAAMAVMMIRSGIVGALASFKDSIP